MPKSLLSCLVSAACLSAALTAQSLTVSEGNMIVTTGSLSAALHEPRVFDLKADALVTDHGYEHQWYYRIAGDTRELSLRNIGGVTGGAFGSVHADRDWANVDNRNQLRVSLDYDCYASGPASGVFISRCTVTNISNAPIVLDMIAYSDLDIANSSGNDSVTGTNSSHFVTDPSGVQVEVRAIGNDLSQASAYPVIRNALLNLAVDNLTGALPPFTGDYTGAFQWTNRTLQPREVRTFQIAFAVDTAAVALPLVEHYGASSNNGLQVHTQFLPLQDNSQPRQIAVQMKGALPGAEYRLAVGQAPISPFPFIPGIDLWIDPFVLVGIYGGLTSPTGEAFELYFVPPSPYLTGFSVYGQAFAVDVSAPNGFANWSSGMRLRIGKL